LACNNGCTKDNLTPSQLYGFQRVADLAPGGSRRVVFGLPAAALSLVDEAGTRRALGLGRTVALHRRSSAPYY
jgi:hypothetical protein